MIAVPVTAKMEGPKEDSERVENIALHEYEQHEAVQDHVMRSKVDDLSVWQCVRQFKVLSLIAMAAAFSASLDGYRGFNLDKFLSIAQCLTPLFTEINLNGGIVANKGFIRQMASPGTTVIAGKYVSAWGGIQSAGQTVGQIVSTLKLILNVLMNSGEWEITDRSAAAAIRHRGLWKKDGPVYHLGGPRCRKWTVFCF